MRTIIQTSLTFLFQIILTVKGWRPYTVELRNLSYVVMEPKIFDFEITNLTLDNKQYFSGYGAVKKDIHQVLAHINILTNYENENFDLVFLNKTFNICEFLTNRRLSIFIEIAYKIMSEHVDVDLPKKCPLWKRLYQVTNLTLNGDFLPPMMPEGKCLIVVTGWIVERGKEIMIGKGSAVMMSKNKYKKIL